MIISLMNRSSLIKIFFYEWRDSAVFSSITSGWSLLNRQERYKLIPLASMLLLCNVFDMFALATVMPVIGLIIQPSIVDHNDVIKFFYDLLSRPNYPLFVTCVGGVSACLISISSFLRFRSEIVLSRYSAQCMARLSIDLAQRLVMAPYSWFLDKNSALLARLVYGDVGFWGNRFVKPIVALIGAVLTVFVSGAMIIVFSPWSGLASIFIVGAILFGILKCVKPKIIMLGKQKRILVDEVMLSLNQPLAGIKCVKVSTTELYFTDLYARNYRQLMKVDVDLVNTQRISPEIMMLFGQVMLVMFAVCLSIYGLSPSEIASQMALLLLVSSRLIPALNKVSSNISGMWDAGAFFDAINGLQNDLKTAIGQSNRGLETHAPIKSNWSSISTINLAFRFPSTKEPTLKNLNIQINRGFSYGVVGLSGTGKSTLIDIILGLLTPSEGCVLIDDSPLTAENIKSWQRCIGYVPQSPFILHDTLRANIAFGVPLDEVNAARLDESIKLAHLEDVVAGLSDGFDTVLGENGVRLSGGQRQRVAIARALYAKPDFLVLDEATSALDSKSEKEIQAAIEDLHGYTTSLIIAHRVGTLRNCDKIFVINNGGLAAQGTYDELLMASNIFRELAGK